MDIGRSISFIFEDEKWIEKVIIGGLIGIASLLLVWTVIGPLIGIALLYGYMVELVRNVRRDEASPLPEWDNWGDKIVEGLKLFVVFFIWALPLTIVMIPVIIAGSVTGNSDFAGILWFCFSCLSVLYGLLLFLVSPGIYIRFAETGEISSGLQFSEIIRFTRDNFGEVIIAAIVVWGINLVAGIVGFFLCLLGIFFTSFWAMLVQSHLYGQIGRNEAFEFGGYDSLSPDDILPDVGELAEEAERSADEAVEQMDDLGESVVEAEVDVDDLLVDISEAEEKVDEEEAGDSAEEEEETDKDEPDHS